MSFREMKSQDDIDKLVAEYGALFGSVKQKSENLKTGTARIRSEVKKQQKALIEAIRGKTKTVYDSNGKPVEILVKEKSIIDESGNVIQPITSLQQTMIAVQEELRSQGLLEATISQILSEISQKSTTSNQLMENLVDSLYENGANYQEVSRMLQVLTTADILAEDLIDSIDRNLEYYDAEATRLKRSLYDTSQTINVLRNQKKVENVETIADLRKQIENDTDELNYFTSLQKINEIHKERLKDVIEEAESRNKKPRKEDLKQISEDLLEATRSPDIREFNEEVANLLERLGHKKLIKKKQAETEIGEIIRIGNEEVPVEGLNFNPFTFSRIKKNKSGVTTYSMYKQDKNLPLLSIHHGNPNKKGEIKVRVPYKAGKLHPQIPDYGFEYYVSPDVVNFITDVPRDLEEAVALFNSLDDNEKKNVKKIFNGLLYKDIGAQIYENDLEDFKDNLFYKILSEQQAGKLPVIGKSDKTIYIGGKLTRGQPKKHAYKIIGTGIGTGSFGRINIDTNALAGQLHLIGEIDGKKVIDKKIDMDTFDLLTKRFNPRRTYSDRAIKVFRKLVDLAGVPFTPTSGKFNLLTDDQKKGVQAVYKSKDGKMVKGGRVKPVIIPPQPVLETADALIERMGIVTASIEAGNDSSIMKNELITIIDKLKSMDIIDSNAHRAIYKKYINI